MKRVIMMVILVSVMLGACNKGLSPHETAAIQNIVSERSFIFEVQTVNPMSGGNIQVTPGFDLTVTPELIDAALPYFGRAFTARLPNEGGYRFTSKQFRYDAVFKENGVSEITIVPQDANDIQQMTLRINPDGYATLQISSTNRQPISYYGRIIKKPATNR